MIQTSQSSPDPAGFDARIRQYLDWMEVKAYSTYTMKTGKCVLSRFAIWCEERGVMRPSEVTRSIMERYQRHLFHSLHPHTQKPFSIAGQYTTLNRIRSFFTWLSRRYFILYNPAADLDLPRPDKRLPRNVLTAQEADRVMNLPDVHTPEGLRDRAILETFYSSAIRRNELRRLDVDDVDLSRGVLRVRLGKGREDRYVPVGERACAWIRAYLFDARPKFLSLQNEKTLFLSSVGRRVSNGILTHMTKKYLGKSGVAKNGACHLFRHTCATLMLDAGASLRHVQEMLGHSDLSTTGLYTHVAIKQLKDVHTLTHPAAKLNPEDENAEDKKDGEEPDKGNKDKKND